MRKIYKYLIPIQGENISITLPRHANYLDIQSQGENICMWCEVDEDEIETETRTFKIFGTGHLINDYNNDLLYIKTVQMPSGLVWHVFEVVSL